MSREEHSVEDGWEKWFAWRPVFLDEPVPFAWFQTIYRRRRPDGRWQYWSGLTLKQQQEEWEDEQW
jgi:hypothetical protein